MDGILSAPRTTTTLENRAASWAEGRAQIRLERARPGPPIFTDFPPVMRGIYPEGRAKLNPPFTGSKRSPRWKSRGWIVGNRSWEDHEENMETTDEHR